MIDITEEFFNSVKCLKSGEMFHSTRFSLEATLSSVEIMEPRTDFTALTSFRKIYNCQQIRELKLFKVDSFNDHERLNIMNLMIGCLCSWLDGTPFVQSVLTCYYLVEFTSVNDVILQEFILKYIALIETIIGVVQKGISYYEEDYNSMDLNLFNLISEKAKNFNQKEPISALDKLKALSIEPEKDDCPIQFLDYMNFLQTFQSILQMTNPSKLALELKEVWKFLMKFQCLLNENEDPPIQLKNGLALESYYEGFDPLLQFDYISSNFCRYNTVFSSEKSFVYLTQLFKQMESLSDFINHTSVDIFMLIEFSLRFTYSNPCLLSRVLFKFFIDMSFVQSNLKLFIMNNNQYLNSKPFNQIVSFNMSSTWNELMMDIFKDSNMKDSLVNIFETIIGLEESSFNEAINIFTFNLSRQRNLLLDFLRTNNSLRLEFKKLLEIKFQKADSMLMSKLVFLYELFSCHIVLHYINIGFKCQLYSHNEFHVIFWYLSMICFSWINLFKQLFSREKMLDASFKHLNLENGIFYNYCDYLKIHWMLYDVAYKISRLFLHDGLIKKPSKQFISDKMLYDQRFSCFYKLSELFSFDFDVYLSLNQQDEIQDRSLHLQEIHKLLETLMTTDFKKFDRFFNQVSSMRKVCQVNLISLKVYEGYRSTKEPIELNIDFSICNIYPVFKTKIISINPL